MAPHEAGGEGVNLASLWIGLPDVVVSQMWKVWWFDMDRRADPPYI